MSESEINYFSASIKKIPETDKEYELITKLNPCFKNLPKETLEQVEDIVLKAVEDIKLVLKSGDKENNAANLKHGRHVKEIKYNGKWYDVRWYNNVYGEYRIVFKGEQRNIRKTWVQETR